MDTICTLSDNDLILGYKNGDCSCFDVLLERYQSKVYGYILSVVKEKEIADDYFQETFFKVITCINDGRYKDENKFIHWVMRIAHNLILDNYRRASKMPFVSNSSDIDVVETVRTSEPEDVESEIIKQQTRSNIRKLIKMLPPEQRRVVILRNYGHYDFKDIAEKTGVSINTALGRMRYAIINLRRLAKENNMYIEL